MRSRLLAYSFIAALGLSASACVATVSSGPVARPAENHAARDGFAYLGERFVNNGNDHDVLEIGRREGKFREVMLVVENAPVELYDLVITFGDGERYEPRTRMRFAAGSTSRAIPLPGGLRVIKRVDFRYGSLVGSGAKVELWGR
ncbi:MAG TPA: hypothetical protein VFP84_23065 [Kofleriaceae bacterium]|nr:hypothetical protein [Kofleriaceae bacterium]